ncbi:hypothetical protein AB0N21_23915 [Streptomyces sp. NPDC051080]|uniref:hypothetical protein n=1 Tax=Streptomyces sp. NPDC051080 TaxID=3157222 RepID=UPI00343CE9F3
MSALPMNGLAAAVTALASLVERFPDLPAADARISPIFPDLLVLSFYRNLGEFEAWRAALSISATDVTLDGDADGNLLWLMAETAMGGTLVRLVGYGHKPQDRAEVTDLVGAIAV